jgi:hypothetical protein
MPDGVGEGRVDARPEKRFFVDMLTRDIELAPAIIDLVDNSIDGAKRIRPEEADDRFDGLSVQIRLEPEIFELLDTCGGFSREHAATYAFKFGRHRNQQPTPGEVGQFGVGMKRAIFKLGREFAVVSRTNGDSWKVGVDVDWWLDEAEPDDWTFPIADANGDQLDAAGTLVRCTKLLPSATTRLGQQAFISRVLREIAMRHALALQQGLVITVNGRELQPRPPSLLVSDALKPISYTESLKDGQGQEVEMQIAAGLASADEGDEEADTDDPELFTGLDAAGWYVFCNGRALLFADRSRLTGWAEEVPRFHPQFRSFRGYVYLSGDSAAMPWTTAKTAVDEDSEIWEQTRKHIVDALRKSVTVMNRVKREVQQRPPDDRPLVSAVKGSRPAMLENLGERRAYDLPPPPPRIAANAKRIAYSVPPNVFQQASEAMETDRPSEIGQRTFTYWMKREVDEDYGD